MSDNKNKKSEKKGLFGSIKKMKAKRARAAKRKEELKEKKAKAKKARKYRLTHKPKKVKKAVSKKIEPKKVINQSGNENYIKTLFKIEPWSLSQDVIYEGDDALVAESLTSIGNSRMGMRGNYEEKYTGTTHQGSYLAGVWYPEPTRCGWWKKGYPQYFGKIVNSVNYIGFSVKIDGIELDLAKQKPLEFHRTLNLKNANLSRKFVTSVNRKKIEVCTNRFISDKDKDIAVIQYTIKAHNDLDLELVSYLDGHVSNYLDGFVDTNRFISFWDVSDTQCEKDVAVISANTKPNNFKTEQFWAAWALVSECTDRTITPERIRTNEFVGYRYKTKMLKGSVLTFTKYVAVVDSRYVEYKDHASVSPSKLQSVAIKKAKEAYELNYEKLKERNDLSWKEKWDNADIQIEGDEKSQQGIRYNIFQLLSTYDGFDSRLNIGPKGFTGEKYGGATYWDTEGYCLPMYLSITKPEVSKNLLLYRYGQLDQAVHNAQMQQLDGALFPMVTFDGIESHNEWEITMEEIHRNTTIAHAIYNYCRYNDDKHYLMTKGLEVLIQIARFWASRVHYSKNLCKYMIHGVTGPNEYENNVNNNWYTNFGAQWVLNYTLSLLGDPKSRPVREKLNVSLSEIKKWNRISANMYLPYSYDLKVIIQNDTFLDKELRTVQTLTADDRPIVQKWSWDKVLRSCFIKQADVLQGIYYWPEKFSRDQMKNNFDFYEPMTVHESSLSPCIHSIIASWINYRDKAVEFYLRTSRLDLDNYNNDTKDGLHITSMAGSWLAIVHGFASMRVIDDKLHFKPFLPNIWKSYKFNINFRGNLLSVYVDKKVTKIDLLAGEKLDIVVYHKDVTITKDNNLVIQTGK